MNETDNNNLSFHLFLFDMKFILEYQIIPNTKSADAFQLSLIKSELNAFCLKCSMNFRI